MNFGITPISPLQIGVTAESYANILKDYKYNPESAWPSLSGKIKIDEKYRLVTFSLSDGIVTGIEICEIEKEDSFCGISMRNRPKKFQKLLAKAGFNSNIDYSGLDLTDHPVGFFIAGGWIASICWK
ncbi:hypothetical protein ACGE24_06470 [Corynebacterium kroppenstedtii]|uniref:hypothetical protein n=1 Tax=Corynebacterium sp. PCR 32 TaxID=3351342 RepID=UPI0030A8D10B